MRAAVSCNGGVLYAMEVPGANKYQFNFMRPGYTRNIASIDPTIEIAVVEITDLFGRRIFTRTIPVESHLDQPLELNNTLAKGVYLLTVTTDERVSTERIVIQ